MKVFAIDPGNEQSAFVLYDSEHHKVIRAATRPNNDIRVGIGNLSPELAEVMVLEQVASFGMPVGAEVFETVFWSGRFVEAWINAVDDFRDWHRIKRLTVKMHLCHDSRAKDSNIRQALIDKFGGKETAIGKKKNPGPLYGISGDQWAALAVAVTFAETQAVELAEVHQ